MNQNKPIGYQLIPTPPLEDLASQHEISGRFSRTVHSFKRDVEKFRRDYEESGGPRPERLR